MNEGSTKDGRLKPGAYCASLAFAAYLSFAAVLALAQTEAHRDKSRNLLQWKIPAMSMSQVPVHEAAAQLLVRARVPGGIAAYVDCNEELFSFELPETTLENALNAVTSSNNSYRWELRNGVIEIFPAEARPELLDTHVELVNSEKEPISVGALSSTLLLSKEIKARIAELKLSPPRLIQISGSVNQNPKKLKLRLQNLPLFAVLDAAAAQHGEAVWEYQENRCRNPREYNLGWRRD